PNFPPSLRPMTQSLIENNPTAPAPPLEWDPPAPPAVTNDMISGGVARGINDSRPLRIFLGQLATVPIFDAFPSRPRRSSRVLGVRFPPTLVACEDRS